MREPLFEHTIDLAAGSTLTNRVYATLKDRILSRSLPPGARLKHAELAAALGVSITPVREAIVELEKDGLVEVIPYRGSVVKQLSAQEVSDVIDVRIALESLAVRRAVDRLTQEDIQELDRNVRDYEKALAADDRAVGLRADLAFHELLLSASGNLLLLELARNLADRIQRVRQADWSEATRTKSLRGHTLVLDALRRGDGESAAALMASHVARGKDRALQSLASQDSDGMNQSPKTDTSE